MRLSNYPEMSSINADDLIPVSKKTQIDGVYETRNIRSEDLKNALGSEGASPDSITDIYDPTGTYYPGDFVMYETQLYKCISAVNPQKEAYIVGETMYGADWLSLTSGGTAISQSVGTPDPINYLIVTPGTEQTGKYYKWDDSLGIYYETELNEPWISGKWQKAQLGNLAFKNGAAVIITSDSTTAPTDTSVLWVYPG